MASPTSTKIPVGTILSEKYRITREIGRGGMAAVYEAENIDIGKRVAIKVLAQELTTSMVVVERFFREARAAAAIRSPYICDVYDSGRLEDGPPFLVLELLEGESLYERMTKVRYFDVATTMAIVGQVCRGLTKAHSANIVHRDLKPENIFITRDEEGALLAKILDFGLAKFYTPLDGSGDPKQARLTREGAVFGTPAYMSPEQVRGQGAVDHRADLWALACIVYECFTGRTVWQTEQGVAMTFAQIASAPVPDPLVFRPDLPPAFKDWFDKALDRRIDQRHQTAREFAEELVGALDPSAKFDTSSAFRFDVSGAYARAAMPAPQPPEPGAHSEFSIPPPPPVNLANAGPQAAAAANADGTPRGTTATFEAPPRSPNATPGTAKVSKEKPPRMALIAAVAAVALVLGGGGFLAWSSLKGDAQATTGSTSASSPVVMAPPSASVEASAKVLPEQPAPPVLPWMPHVSEAQEAMKKADHKSALKHLKDAFDKGGHGVPRTMLEHVQVAIGAAAAKSPCLLTGLGRPRTYDLKSATSRRSPAGRPYIAMGPNGPIVAWTDTHEGLERAYTVVLDDALRPVADPIDITPEGGAVSRPTLIAHGSEIAFLYTDGRGISAGVHGRLLQPDGTIASPMASVGPLKAPSSGSSIARVADGTYVAVWAAEIETGSEELFIRRLSPKLEPIGEVVRATDFAPIGLQKPRVRLPQIAIAGDAAQIVFRLERSPQQIVYRMRVPLADLTKNVEPRKKGENTDHWIGETIVVNTDKSRSDTPSLACSKDACYLTWDIDGFGGLSAALIDPGTAQPLWRNKFSRSGGHPVVAIDDAGGARVVWFEKGGIMTAMISRTDVGPASKIGRVSGAQPAASMVPGKNPGEWLITWLDFEAGQLEPYVARFVCQ